MGDELTEEERLENLKKIIRFMDSDLSIKKSLFELAPEEKDLYGDEAIMNYFEKQYDKVQDIEFYFSKMIDSIPDFKDMEPLITEKIHEIKNNMLKNIEYSKNGVEKSYKTYISDLSLKLVERVKKELVGYTGIYSAFIGMLDDVGSFNDLLHIMHSYIINNKDILESMPIIAKKENKYNTFTLYGKETEESKKIFEKIDPEKTRAGTTQILALDNRILMMVRDLGHALTLDIDTSENKPLVKYFIPKITNAKWVSQLRGLVTFKSQDDNAIGMFQIDDSNNIAEEVMDFIEKVPGDSEKYLEGGVLFNRDPLEELRSELAEQEKLDVQTKLVAQVAKVEQEIKNQNSQDDYKKKKDEAKWIDRMKYFYYKTSDVRNVPENSFGGIMEKMQKDKANKENMRGQ